MHALANETPSQVLGDFLNLEGAPLFNAEPGSIQEACGSFSAVPGKLIRQRKENLVNRRLSRTTADDQETTKRNVALSMILRRNVIGVGGLGADNQYSASGVGTCGMSPRSTSRDRMIPSRSSIIT